MNRIRLLGIVICLVLFSFMFPKLLLAQGSVLKGTIRDVNDIPLTGVNVVEKGTTNGTISDIDGNFSLNVPANSTIVFTYIGFSEQEVVWNGRSVLNIVLHEDTELLDEVVVIGYGTVKKRDLTGAVSSIKGDELTSITVTDPALSLQGRIPGVSIAQNTGDPAGDYTIRIRGINSIKGDNSPLFIIDGIPASTTSINTYDIESLEVLKDASATAIYGSRGANGVVLITTKKGKEGKAKVKYNFEYGQQSQIKKLDLMDAQEWAKFYNEYLVNTGTLPEPQFSEQEIAKMGKGTDWQKLMFRNAPLNHHNITVSGGADNINYFVSGSALSKDGLIKNSSYNKYNLRSNLNFVISSLLDASIQMGYTASEAFNQSNGGGVGGSSMIGAVYSASPLFTPYDENGDYKDLRSWFAWSSHEVKNPINMAYESTYKTRTNSSNINASINFMPFDSFSFKGIFGLENADSRYDGYTTSRYLYQNNSASVNHNRTTNLTNEFIANYNFHSK
jgi:TonB-linked SusC/RagA family outer membrane protein